MWHLGQAAELPSPPPIETDPLLLLLQKAGGGETKQRNTQPRIWFRELRAAMFAAAPAFRNKGAINRHGEISAFHNTSCSGRGPLLPPRTTAVLLLQLHNATASGVGDHATNNSHKPLDISISCRWTVSCLWVNNESPSTVVLANVMGTSHLPGTETRCIRSAAKGSSTVDAFESLSSTEALFPLAKL